MTVDTQKIRELLEKATPGPWAVRYDYVVQAPSFDDGRLVPVAQPYGVNSDGTDLFANARLIAAARNALPALLAENDALSRQNEGLREQHDRDSRELRQLCEARDQARKSAQYWKDQHLAGNAEIDRLSAELQAHRSFLSALKAELGLVLTDDDTEVSPGALRTLLWADREMTNALALPPAPPQGDGA